MKIQSFFFNCIVGLAFISLTVVGAVLISQSNQMYKYSVKIADKALNPEGTKSPVNITPAYTLIRDGYGQALMFFTLALGSLFLILLLPRLQNLSIGPAGITLALKEVKENLSTVIKQANDVQSNSAGEGGKIPPVKKDLRKANLEAIVNDTEPPNDDPQKGEWGGKASNNFRKITALVEKTQWPGYYKVDITVESTKKQFPLEGTVKFYLHDTFINPNPIIAVENGMAILKLKKVYGAFTVGAEADNGETKLELDLAKLDEAPQEFKDN